MQREANNTHRARGRGSPWCGVGACVVSTSPCWSWMPARVGVGVLLSARASCRRRCLRLCALMRDVVRLSFRKDCSGRSVEV
eukprot:7259151-Pyramimonas_sp.AAC.1